ncbi:MAG: peroxisomal membrane protein pex14 [Piccolia ochrophora]|nr:MAG: peroxisomal membrane protein pex14 [Piccolia ochrophora]
MVREDLLSSAVTFLQDPSVAGSPVEKRIAFLQSKNLTKNEIEAALARAGEDPSVAANATSSLPESSNYGYQNQQVTRQPPDNGYRGYPPGYWQQQAPPELPRRDWRDWFIMATLMSGVSYGLYVVAKRYIYPLIAPPTAPQLEQDKKSVEESFERAFALLEQLSSDTETLKTSEQARTERLDTALREVESVIGELKATGRRREDESRRIGDEVRGLKDLIPKALDAQKETTNTRLKELNTELKGLKTLVGNRMGAAPRTSSANGTTGAAPSGSSHGSGTATPSNGASTDTVTNGGPVGGASGASEGDKRSNTPSNVRPSFSGPKDSPSVGSSGSRAGIPAWQMAAASKNSASGQTLGSGSGAETQAGGST